MQIAMKATVSWVSAYPSILRIIMCSLVLFVCAGHVCSQSTSSARRSVFINGTRLDNYTLNVHEGQYGTRVPNGRYWYDPVCGAWGNEGGPMRGLTLPGLNLGGPLRADASRGRTGVFVNGRELHRLDVMALRQLGPVVPGRYWVDAWGNCGYEGGPALFNLVELASASRRGGGSNRTGRGRRKSVLTTWDRTGIAVF